MYVSDALFGQKRFSFSNLTHVPFLTKSEFVYKNVLKRSVLKSQFQNPRNLDEKDWFFHMIDTKITSNSQRNKKD